MEKLKKYSFVFWCGYVSNEDGKPSMKLKIFL